MSKTEETLSGEQIREYATKDLVICELSGGTFNNREGYEPLTKWGYETSYNVQGSSVGTTDYDLSSNFPMLITRYPATETRKIGYIAGVNSDGSYQMYILGSGNLQLNPSHKIFSGSELHIVGRGRFLPPEMEEYWTPEHASDFGAFQYTDGIVDRGARNAWTTKYQGTQQYVSDLDSFMYIPEWVGVPTGAFAESVVRCGKKGNDYLIDLHTNTFELTNDISTTVKLGEGLNTTFWQRSQAGFYYGDKNVGGDLHDLLDTISLIMCNSVANLPYSICFSTLITDGADGNQHDLHIMNTYPPIQGFMAFHYTPYNLILTYDLQQAKRYVETGELPSDAFLYPFDVDNIPVNTTGGTGADDSDGTQPDDTPNTGGNSGGEDTDEQSPVVPTNTPQALTNNNLYWLTSTQLKHFIEWFWTDATDVTNPQELFEKIQGLYSDLSQAIVSIRYMPIDASWVGGTTIDNSIIVGLVEKTEQVQTINKTVAPVRDIATNISISELPDFKGFINFSPYCEMSLYLPFYGYLSLDADLLMQNKLTIKATYDILSGTIQYYIFRVSSKTGDATMINTVTGKMAVDIPISLQTKNERDSMIFNNVASATANLIGAGASAVAGNPIGMVMSTSAIAGQQSQGAPMRVMGTIGESGAFYDHGYCAIFIKRPATNYPPQYARRVGYPYNGARKLEKTHGFVQCFNPYISFSHVTTEDSDGFPPPKPTAEEIETIYNALQDGVYLP